MQLARILTGNFLFAARLDQSQARNLLQNGQRDVGGDTEVHHQSLLVTVFGNVGNAVMHGLPGRADVYLLALEPDLSALGAVDTEKHPRDLGAPGSHQPREAQDFATA